jgi:mRNA interferase MazF
MKKYIPQRGDIIWMEFTPQLGHEQSGRRPALVISPKSYNEKTNLCIILPITSQVKNYPFEVSLNGKNIQGVILTDQIKSFDWFKRKAKKIESTTEFIIQECLVNTNLLLMMT